MWCWFAAFHRINTLLSVTSLNRTVRKLQHSIHSLYKKVHNWSFALDCFMNGLLLLLLKSYAEHCILNTGSVWRTTYTNQSALTFCWFLQQIWPTCSAFIHIQCQRKEHNVRCCVVRAVTADLSHSRRSRCRRVHRRRSWWGRSRGYTADRPASPRMQGAGRLPPLPRCRS